MYLSSLLVEDGIRHLFHINLTVCLASSLLTLLRVFQLPHQLGTCVCGIVVHIVPHASSLISYLSYQSILDDTHLAAATLATLPSLHR